MNTNLEFTRRQLERIDEVEIVVYDCLLILAEKNEEEFPWNMEYIGEAADMLCDFLVSKGIPVRYPAIVDGHITDWYSEYRGDADGVG